MKSSSSAVCRDSVRSVCAQLLSCEAHDPSFSEGLISSKWCGVLRCNDSNTLKTPSSPFPEKFVSGIILCVNISKHMLLMLALKTTLS